MSRLRWTLVALLAVSTVLFAVGVIAERSEAPEAAQTEAAGGEAAGTREGAGAAESEEGNAEPASDETSSEQERVLGIDLESTALVVLAVLAGLGLAALTATRFGRLRGFLLPVALVTLAWAALDLREVVDQLDESRTGVALAATMVAVLHLAAAAVSARLAQQPGAAS